MSGDEVVVTLIAVVAGPGAWAFWLFRARSAHLVRRRGSLDVVSGALAVATLLILAVLRTLASFDVVADLRYQFMYLVLGLAWLRIVLAAFAFAGLSARDDVVERGNTAAAIALAGGLIGAALCYAGGNIGDGPGWWVVVFSAGLSTVTSLALWIVLTLCTPVVDAIAIERDRAAGARLAGFLIALGLVLGRGVAGNWVSTWRTVADLSVALPAVVIILAIAIAIERFARLTPDRPRGALLAFGVLPALAYMAVAITSVGALGWMP